MVSYKRHILKAISYRIVSTTIGFLAMWFFTGSIKIGATFSVIELVWKPIQYFLHERIWYTFSDYGIKKENLKNDDSNISN
jgi:uncharacterized membrane protein